MLHAIIVNFYFSFYCSVYTTPSRIHSSGKGCLPRTVHTIPNRGHSSDLDSCLRQCTPFWQRFNSRMEFLPRTVNTTLAEVVTLGWVPAQEETYHSQERPYLWNEVPAYVSLPYSQKRLQLWDGVPAQDNHRITKRFMMKKRKITGTLCKEISQGIHMGKNLQINAKHQSSQVLSSFA